MSKRLPLRDVISKAEKVDMSVKEVCEDLQRFKTKATEKYHEIVQELDAIKERLKKLGEAAEAEDDGNTTRHHG